MFNVTKRRIAIAATVAAFAAGIGVGGFIAVSATTNPPRVTGGQVMTRSWYTNNFVAANPNSVATDGVYVWTTGYSAANVQKFTAATGALVGTYSLPAGCGPTSIAFDGTNIWVAAQNSSSVYKVNGSTGAIMTTAVLPASSAPQALTVDVSAAWTANSNNTVSKISISNGAVLGTYPLPAGSIPRGIASDGYNVYVANQNSSTVSKLSWSTGAVLSTIALPASSNPQDIMFDGAFLWTANSGTSSVSKIKPSTGVVVGTYPLPNAPVRLALDQPGYSIAATPTSDSKTYIWASGGNANNLTKIDALTGAVVATYPSGDRAIGLAFDGTYMWVANEVGGSITKIQVR